MARPTPTRQAQTAIQQKVATQTPTQKQPIQDAFGVPTAQRDIGSQSSVKKIYHIPELTAQAVRWRDQVDPLVQMYNQNSDFPITEDDVIWLYEYTKQEHPEITDKQARIEKSLEYIPVLKKMKEEDGTLSIEKSPAQWVGVASWKYAQWIGDYFSGKPISTEREIAAFTNPLWGDEAATPLTALNLAAKWAANIIPNAISTVKSLREIVSNTKQTVDWLKMIWQGIIDKTQWKDTTESKAVAKIRKDIQESADSPEEIWQFLFEHPLDVLSFVTPKSVVEWWGTLLRAVKSWGKNAVKAIESATAPTTRAVAGADELAQIMAWTSVWAADVAWAVKMTPEISKYINKSIKPTVINKSQNVKGLEEFEKHALNAVNTIIDNEKNIKLLDEGWELVSRTPVSVREFADAIDQTKSSIYTEYNTLAQQAGNAWAVVHFDDTIDELRKTQARLEKMVGTKDTVKYIDDMIADLEEIKTLNVVDAQQNVQLLNEKLQAFYRNPSHNDVGKAAIDALVNSKLREWLTASIEAALDAPEYAVLRRKYASLKAIEKEVNKRAIVLARQSQKWLLDFTDIVSADQVVSWLIKLGYGNVWWAAADIAWGGAMKVIKDYYKSLNSPDVNIKKLFEEVKKQRGVTWQKGADFSKVGTTKVPENLQSMSNESIIDKDLAKRQIMDKHILDVARKYKSIEDAISNGALVVRGEMSSVPSKVADRIPSQFAEGEYFTNEPAYAKTYWDKIVVASPPSNPYIYRLDKSVPYRDAMKKEFGTSDPKAVTEKLISEWYDGLIVKDVFAMRNNKYWQYWWDVDEIIKFDKWKDKMDIEEAQEYIKRYNDGQTTMVKDLKTKTTKKYKSVEEALHDPYYVARQEAAIPKKTKVAWRSNNLYHTTKASNIDSIMKEWLKAWKQARYEWVSSPTKISFSANEDAAKYYGWADDILIRTKTSYKPKDLEQDLLAGWEWTYVTSDNIPPDMLEVKVNGKRIPLKEYKNVTK